MVRQSQGAGRKENGHSSLGGCQETVRPGADLTVMVITVQVTMHMMYDNVFPANINMRRTTVKSQEKKKILKRKEKMQRALLHLSELRTLVLLRSEGMATMLLLTTRFHWSTANFNQCVTFLNTASNMFDIMPKAYWNTQLTVSYTKYVASE